MKQQVQSFGRCKRNSRGSNLGCAYQMTAMHVVMFRVETGCIDCSGQPLAHQSIQLQLPMHLPSVTLNNSAIDLLATGSPGSNSSSRASPNSPGSPIAYSPTAAAAATAAALHGHSMYSMSQPGLFSHSMYAGGYYHQDGLPGWQGGFIQGVGYGQPMRAYR